MSLKNKLRNFVKYSFKVSFNTLKNIPKDEKIIVFESFNGRQFSDNPRAIYEYIKENHPEYKLFWSVDKNHKKYFEDNNLNILIKFTPEWLFYMNRAKYWVTNSRFPNWFKKSENTVYVQTWHGTPLKKLGLDMKEVHLPNTNEKKYKENFVHESSKWDYLISPNKYSTDIFKRAFAFNKKMIESGYPRNDFLVNCNNEENINKIKSDLNIPLDKKVILYAPTWRDNEFYHAGKYKFNLKLDLDKMKEKYGEDHVVILRLHYLVAENLDLSNYDNFVIDFSKHGDIRDLYIISDLLITDYSSVFFDYSILKKPIIFFVYDLVNYRDVLRGFYFDFEKEAPGPLLTTSDEVISEIDKIINNNYVPLKNYEEFSKRFIYLEDGKATERAVKEFLKIN